MADQQIWQTINPNITLISIQAVSPHTQLPHHKGNWRRSPLIFAVLPRLLTLPCKQYKWQSTQKGLLDPQCSLFCRWKTWRNKRETFRSGYSRPWGEFSVLSWRFSFYWWPSLGVLDWWSLSRNWSLIILTTYSLPDKSFMICLALVRCLFLMEFSCF